MVKTSRFISVEIAIRTHTDCDEWVRWFEKKDNHVSKLKGEEYKWFIYFAPLPLEDANKTIQDLCNDIENLPPHVRIHWDNANEKEFYVGYRVGEQPLCYNEHFEIETLKRTIELGASIRIAMYSAPDS